MNRFSIRSGALALAAVMTVVTASGAYRERSAKAIAARIPKIAAVRQGELQVTPSFISCSLRWGVAAPVEGLRLETRRRGESDDDWSRALAPEYFDEVKEYRGSMLYLDEDTDYEFRLTAGDKTLASGRFRTWKSDVPVAKTVFIDPEKTVTPLRISDKGTEKGWIRYTIKGGRTWETADGRPAIVLDGAEYVLIDDMRIRGCREVSSIIRVMNTKYVRIRNCDLSGWGRTGYHDHGPEACGKYRELHPSGPRARVINYDGAIYLERGVVGTVVERCWVHDPVSTANSWFYSHPAGPEAVVASYCGPGTVIRYNDFVGSDLHRWNDAVEGPGNFDEDGGLNRDADVYGNFMIFCNDDNIELDGGQLNVRCFRNRFEQAVSGVSIQGCMVGPSYVFDNAFTGMGDEMGIAYGAIKTSGIALYGNEVSSYIFRNEFWDRTSGINVGEPKVRFWIKRNRFETGNRFGGIGSSPKSVEADTVANAGIRRDGPVAMPYRPVPFRLDRGMIEGVKVEKGVVTPQEVKVTATVEGADWSSPFVIAKNDAFDWFEVVPASGTLQSGRSVELTVRFNAAKMNDRRHYRGAFLVRTPDGYSRPVSVYATTDFIPPYKGNAPEKHFVSYLDAFAPAEGTLPKTQPEPNGEFGKVVVLDGDFKKSGAITYAFDIPKDGLYFIHMRGYGAGDLSIEGRIDDLEWTKVICTAIPYMSWAPVSFTNLRKHPDNRVNGIEFTAGRHTMTLRTHGGNRTYYLEGLGVTDNPDVFEPR